MEERLSLESTRPNPRETWCVSPAPVTASIGLVEIAPDAEYTSHDLLIFANSAKQFAKENGKNCLASHVSPDFSYESIEIFYI
jgi:GGDEF domain-containing protein